MEENRSTRLCRLLEGAFSRPHSKSLYTLAPWSISFVERTWDTYFELYYFGECILTGNTSDKQFTLLTADAGLKEKILKDFALSLPKYKPKPSEIK